MTKQERVNSLFREGVMKFVREYGVVELKLLLNAACEHVTQESKETLFLDQRTGKKYLDEMCTRKGLYRFIKIKTGTRIITAVVKK